MYGILFPKDTEAAYSLLRVCEALGVILCMVCSTVFCIDDKIYLMITLFVAAIIGYSTIEILEFNKKKKLQSGVSNN